MVRHVPRVAVSVIGSLVAAAWIVTLVLMLIGVARMVAFDRARLLTMLNAFSAWLYLPVWPIAIGAFVTGRVVLGAAASAVVLLHVVLVGAPLPRTISVPPGASTSLRVVSANLRFRNGRMAQLGAELAAYDADVVMLQEVTPAWWAVLCEPEMLGAYEHRACAVLDNPGGAVICSRFPLRGICAEPVEGWPLLQATVVHPAGAFRCIDVHPAPPPYGFARHRAMVEAIFDAVRDAHEDGVPVLVAGDFNLTQYNRVLAQMRALGLRAAHDARRRVFAVTWPNGRRRLPPIRIDHVLATAPLVPVRVEHGRGTGSDHRPVVVDFAIGAGPYTSRP